MGKHYKPFFITLSIYFQQFAPTLALHFVTADQVFVPLAINFTRKFVNYDKRKRRGQEY